jgi:hypothetical protein
MSVVLPHSDVMRSYDGPEAALTYLRSIDDVFIGLDDDWTMRITVAAGGRPADQREFERTLERTCLRLGVGCNMWRSPVGALHFVTLKGSVDKLRSAVALLIGFDTRERGLT